MFSETRPDPPITSRILTRPDQLRMTPKVEISKCNINIFHVVEFIFKSVQGLVNTTMTCTKSMHSEKQKKTMKTQFIFKTQVFSKTDKNTFLEFLPYLTLSAVIYKNLDPTRPDLRADPTHGHLCVSLI